MSIEFDSLPSARIWNAGTHEPGGGSVVFNFAVPTRQAVDDLYAHMTAGGYKGQQPPYDAFWGSALRDRRGPGRQRRRSHESVGPGQARPVARSARERVGVFEMADLDVVKRLGAAEHGLVVIAVARPSGTVHTSVVNAGVLDDPDTGQPCVGFVAPRRRQEARLHPPERASGRRVPIRLGVGHRRRPGPHHRP